MISFIHFFLLFFFHVAFTHLTSFLYQILNIVLSILLFLSWSKVFIIHLLLLCVFHFLDSICVFFSWHIVLLIVIFWCILNNVSIWADTDYVVVLLISNSISWWWNVFTLLFVVELDTLYSNSKM